MIIYPAIDLKDQRCVRLVQGRKEDAKVYSEDPVEMARHWESLGGKALHLVDLDRAISGSSGNLEVIRRIIESIRIPVQIGGGIRTEEAARELFQCGADRIILGTKAVEDKDFLKKLVDQYKEKVVVSVDTKEGKVAILGWTQSTDIEELDFLKELEAIGVENIVYTDISKDGMMQGPNLSALGNICRSTRMGVIASGGVTSLEDVRHLTELESDGLAGIIIGKALYEGTIKLNEAVALC